MGPRLEWARRRGVTTRLSPIVRTPGELDYSGFLLFDIACDGEMHADEDGLLKARLERIRQGLARRGARRYSASGAPLLDARSRGRPGRRGRAVTGVEHRGVFPEGFTQALPEMAEISRWLRREREFVFYGDVDVIPTESYGREDALRAAGPAGCARRPPGGGLPPG